MRTSNIAIRDIMSKRQKRSKQYLDPTDSIQVINPFATGKQIHIQTIIDKIEKTKAKKPTKCEVNNEEKYAIIETISEKQKASFNKHTLTSLMTVWKIPGCHELELTEENIRRSSTRQQQNVSNDKNYFVLNGTINIFEKEKVKGKKNALNERIFDDDEGVFGTETKFDINKQIEIQGTPNMVIEQFSGCGPLFKKKMQRKDISLVAIDAIIVEIKNPEFDNLLMNLGGMDQDKKAKIIQHFPVFSSIGKRIQSILPYIELRHYTRNQNIYKANQLPQAMYLIIKGQVIFQMKVYSQPQRVNSTSLNVNDTSRHHSDTVFQTETLGMYNYFGEEEILNKCQRKLTAVCHSAQCELLEIPMDKFEKLLSNSDFREVIQINSGLKMDKRQQKIEKALKVYVRMSKNNDNNKHFESLENTQRSNIADLSLTRRKKHSQPPKVMHGNVIKRVRANNNGNDVNFSMLKANPDMYAATMKKFRKFTMKPMEKYKPDVNWNLKRVWKVLNLENILREDAEVSSPEGRKFFESHRRFQNHVNQVKSLRPKTSSSTYRTKLQYISYLQQFNN